MIATEEADVGTGGRRPHCLAGADAEAKRYAAWKAAWDSRICCCGLTRAGEQCKNQPMRGRPTCRLHGPESKSRHPLKKAPTSLAVHAREMRRLWRADPWAAGYTVQLDPDGQQRLESWAASEGIKWSWFSPATRDFAAWGFLNACRSGRHPDDDAGASDSLAERIRQRDRKDGLQPPGSHPDRMATSRLLARYREVPPLGEKAPGWMPSRNGTPRRVVRAAAMELARDRALAAFEPQNRKEAVARLLAMERLARRASDPLPEAPPKWAEHSRDRDGW